ncbi:L-ascorbate metabolism protein UlaG (beta-lactamase superfamily) [Streptosporangium becharense]|uniref:L-ascorbate metabolism protein UlaG (Beta-lactamase superfamily) n=1 Tax=Streptosporangium becharense TaxID=1816182 RepID=A0A7W9II32_9ACTN|nr:MBL fold metallo-hydrolase [Streptosporangium becharense]MBB2913487.1 L-ascorbate metabolism protein UlaG (beta-lactamase superfamily) [Streptosporangium becharense]MBB5821177.1 L-ascorbate metabolism protein UlaG (beta-lactamase superfamily) [Streptosporangium becharense]
MSQTSHPETSISVPGTPDVSERIPAPERVPTPERVSVLERVPTPERISVPAGSLPSPSGSGLPPAGPGLPPQGRIRPARRPAPPDEPGERSWPGGFRDRLTTPLPAFQELVTTLWHGGLRRPRIEDAGRIPVRRGALPPVVGTDAVVTWVGHATYVLQIGGLTVLTDPVWSRRIPGIRPRLTPPGVEWADLPPVDAVVISHNHYDHLDAPTVRRLPRSTPILVPAGLRSWFTRRGFHDVVELDWWESAYVGDVRFDFVPAHHWSRRAPWDTCKTLWGGWVVASADQTIYFAGDTGYGERFAQIGARYPEGIDLALMPVGAFEPRWYTKASHVDPEEAVQACRDVGARRMATMHWGTFVLSGEPLLAPVEQARAAWEAAGRDRADLWDLAVGESRVLST